KKGESASRRGCARWRRRKSSARSIARATNPWPRDACGDERLHDVEERKGRESKHDRARRASIENREPRQAADEQCGDPDKRRHPTTEQRRKSTSENSCDGRRDGIRDEIPAGRSSEPCD